MPKFKPGDTIFFYRIDGLIGEAEFCKYDKYGNILVIDPNYREVCFFPRSPITREEAVAARLMEEVADA